LAKPAARVRRGTFIMVEECGDGKEKGTNPRRRPPWSNIKAIVQF
jgi:hypothetical protein